MEVRQKYQRNVCGAEWTLIWNSDRYKNKRPPEVGDFPAFLACNGGYVGCRMFPVDDAKRRWPDSLYALMVTYFMRRAFEMRLFGEWDPTKETVNVTHEGFAEILKDEAWSNPSGPDIQEMVGKKKPRFWGMKINIID